jgi:hypothetical protein
MGDIGLQNGTWGPSVGLWQIRSLKAQYGTGGDRDASRLTDPAFNAKAMVSISGAGANWRPWSTYTHGSYKKYLSQLSGSAFAGATATAGAGTDGKHWWDFLGPGFGGLIPGVTSPAQDVAGGPGSLDGLSGLSTAWGNDAMTIGLKILGGAAAAGLVIAGAIHTVK